MNDDQRRRGGSLFYEGGEDSDGYRGESRLRPSSGRIVNLWLNIGFVVVLIGLFLGADSSAWFFVVAVLWVGAGVVVIARRRRNQPAPRKLFDDDDE